MRPIRLEISGLNSYIEKQVVDFSELTSRGLFGIFGKTGSGKSTILDAITIAMYGNISRDTKEYINTSSDSAKIKYVFEIGNKHNKRRYCVERDFRRSKSGTANSSRAILTEIHMDNTESVIAEQKMNVDKAIIDIVGLTASDFTRSVVLPQGKFSEFLQLDDSKRREMLERIFNLEKYGRSLTEKIKNKRDGKKIDIEVLENSLLQYDGTSQEIFDETYNKLTELQALSRDMRRELDEAEKKYNDYKEIIGYQQSLRGDSFKMGIFSESNSFVMGWQAQDIVPVNSHQDASVYWDMLLKIRTLLSSRISSVSSDMKEYYDFLIYKINQTLDDN